jgi:hypothetical protein
MRTTSSLPNLSKSFLPILGLLDYIYAAKLDDSVQCALLAVSIVRARARIYEGGTVVRQQLQSSVAELVVYLLLLHGVSSLSVRVMSPWSREQWCARSLLQTGDE